MKVQVLHSKGCEREALRKAIQDHEDTQASATGNSELVWQYNSELVWRMDRRLIRVFACAQKALGRAHNNDIVRSCDFPAYWKECFPRRADALLHYIDLHDQNVTAFTWYWDRITGQRKPAYQLDQITGLDVGVQETLIRQKTVAECILKAILAIEAHDCREFAFVCRGGTHRSVGCACLLLMLAYPAGRLVLTTPRTQQDARDKGLRHDSA